MNINPHALTPMDINSASIVNIFQNSLIAELNIYNQAHLEVDTPLIKIGKIHQKTSHELGVEFQLQGQLEGSVSCFIDTFQKDISITEGKFFKSLFIESMNIFMGQILTKLENENDISVMITNPQFIDKGSQHEIVTKKDNVTMGVGYKFISIHNEFDCRIILNIVGL